MNNNIGVLIKELRLAKHISQSSLCENICSKEYISKIENGHKIPSDKILKDIFNKLGENISAFYPMLSIAELIEFNADKKQIDDYLVKHEIDNCILYLDELSTHTLYLCDEPLQYLLGKRAYLMAQYKEDYKTAYELSIKALGITKVFYNIDEVLNYHLYTLEELWTLFNIAFILQRAPHLNKLTPIQLYTHILNYLHRGILNYDMIRQIYPLTCSYLADCYSSQNEHEKANYYIGKGIDFFRNNYALSLNFLNNLENRQRKKKFKGGRHNREPRKCVVQHDRKKPL